MKCRECDCCHEVVLSRWSSVDRCWVKKNVYQCWGVQEPFEISDIDTECTEYEYKGNKNVKDVCKHLCRYCNANNCNDFIPINNTVEYSGIELAINRQGMLRARYYDVNGDTFETQDIIKIKCCPMCGREFNN